MLAPHQAVLERRIDQRRRAAAPAAGRACRVSPAAVSPPRSVSPAAAHEPGAGAVSGISIGAEGITALAAGFGTLTELRSLALSLGDGMVDYGKLFYGAP